MTTPKEIETMYPYMFKGKNIGISIPKGWILLFKDLCDEIDRILGADRQGFHWSQCKEKFGSARLYFDWRTGRSPIRIDLIFPGGFQGFSNQPKYPKSVTPDQAAKRNAIAELVKKAEFKTNSMCICCGAEGKRVNTGWILVLCDKHEKMNHDERSGSGLDGLIWFGKEDDCS